jgi:hypothetical protein
MIRRAYDAILLDLDGTLVDEADRIHPRTLEALRSAAGLGVVVIVATGRSETATLPVLEQLDVGHPAVVYNGAGLYCPVERRLVEERTLSDRAVRRTVSLGLERGWATVTMCAGVKYAALPERPAERRALSGLTGITYVSSAEELLAPYALRVTLFSDRHASSAAFAGEIEAHLARPAYLTHFPLACLPHHRDSELLVCDVHPPCRGKAEGLRVLEERWGIPPERAVAVGDAGNDVPMMEAAGLGVAMGNAFPEALPAADRLIGRNDTDAIGLLVEELFLG